MRLPSIPLKTFPIGPFNCTHEDFLTILRQFPPFYSVNATTPIYGPFDGKINTIYKVELASNRAFIFRTRISRAFRYEQIVKEKILYPFLDGSLTRNTHHLKERINKITTTLNGSYIFTTTNPAIVPIQNLLYFYEPSKPILVTEPAEPKQIYPPAPFPYLLTIKEFLPGNTLFDLLKSVPSNQKNSPAILDTFESAGTSLGLLHTIQFDGFYDKITEIGDSTKKMEWEFLFATQWKNNFSDAAQYPAFKRLIPAIERFHQQNKSLAVDDIEPVLFHNDYQSQNLIFEELSKNGWNNSQKFKLTGIIDFDNWRIGPRAQDFVKMEFWTIQGNQSWLDAFYRGYGKYCRVGKELNAKIQLYKLLWLMLVYAFEMDKVRKLEQNITVDNRFPAAEKYLPEIELIIRQFL